MKALRAGDVIELDVDEVVKGHEQKGRRPALVVSIDEFHELGMAIVCPVTTHGGKAGALRNDLEVAIPPGFTTAGVILSTQVKTIDWRARHAAAVDHLPRATLLAVRARLKLFLGL